MASGSIPDCLSLTQGALKLAAHSTIAPLPVSSAASSGRVCGGFKVCVTGRGSSTSAAPIVKDRFAHQLPSGKNRTPDNTQSTESRTTNTVWTNPRHESKHPPTYNPASTLNNLTRSKETRDLIPKPGNCRGFAAVLSQNSAWRIRSFARLSSILRLSALALLTLVAACNRNGPDHKVMTAAHDEGALFRVGSITVYESDLKRELEERHAAPNDKEAKTKALDELVTRAQFAEAALAAKLDRDPAVRAQMAHALAARYKEQNLLPRLKELSAPIPESRLRELYHAAEGRFRSGEKRQVAVLWLNPNGDPERTRQYQEKLTAAREWFSNHGDLKDHPDQGFSVLSVDYSEHAASRYKGGIVGWLEREGGMDAWSKAVAEIVFSLKEPGEVSAVITRSEGVFLVRYMALKPAVLRPFEAVSDELERAERQRLRAAAEAEFESGIKTNYSVQWLVK